MNYSVDKIFDRNNFREEPLELGEYENCVFRQCDFSNTDLSEIKFTTVEFIGCNLSLAKVTKTAFRDIIFKECKILGLHFENCNEFGLAFSFENCQLNHSSFYKTTIKKTNFKNSSLKETDFTECDLTNSVFENCDLTGATFDHTNLEQVDFRTSVNYSIDPVNNRIRKAKFSIMGISGLLDKYDIKIENSI
ncbi:MAG: pentapeptide repeat-containing protein [Pedobacter sp.]|jgi:uncharacterized protein YjbI with pentapeptide repeats